MILKQPLHAEFRYTAMSYNFDRKCAARASTNSSRTWMATLKHHLNRGVYNFFSSQQTPFAPSYNLRGPPEILLHLKFNTRRMTKGTEHVELNARRRRTTELTAELSLSLVGLVALHYSVKRTPGKDGV